MLQILVRRCLVRESYNDPSTQSTRYYIFYTRFARLRMCLRFRPAHSYYQLEKQPSLKNIVIIIVFFVSTHGESTRLEAGCVIGYMIFMFTRSDIFCDDTALTHDPPCSTALSSPALRGQRRSLPLAWAFRD